MALYPIGIPLMYFRILYNHREDILIHESMGIWIAMLRILIQLNHLLLTMWFLLLIAIHEDTSEKVKKLGPILFLFKDFEGRCW